MSSLAVLKLSQFNNKLFLLRKTMHVPLYFLFSCFFSTVLYAAEESAEARFKHGYNAEKHCVAMITNENTSSAQLKTLVDLNPCMISRVNQPQDQAPGCFVSGKTLAHHMIERFEQCAHKLQYIVEVHGEDLCTRLEESGYDNWPPFLGLIPERKQLHSTGFLLLCSKLQNLETQTQSEDMQARYSAQEQYKIALDIIEKTAKLNPWVLRQHRYDFLTPLHLMTALQIQSHLKTDFFQRVQELLRPVERAVYWGRHFKFTIEPDPLMNNIIRHGSRIIWNPSRSHLPDCLCCRQNCYCCQAPKENFSHALFWWERYQSADPDVCAQHLENPVYRPWWMNTFINLINACNIQKPRKLKSYRFISDTPEPIYHSARHQAPCEMVPPYNPAISEDTW
jgi:hypothetical protein